LAEAKTELSIESILNLFEKVMACSVTVLVAVSKFNYGGDLVLFSFPFIYSGLNFILFRVLSMFS
jgi:hypothetical protein